MLLNKIFVDIGNTSVDIKFQNKCYKFYKENKKEIIDTIDSFNSKNLYISSVNKKTLSFIYKKYKRKKYVIEILDKNKMISYAKENKYDIPNIDILGADLFCDLVACNSSEDYIIVDLGTVGKILVANKNKKFLGGMIIPGITTFPKSVTYSTDLDISEFNDKDINLLNYDTDKCVFSGSINGISSMINDLIKRIIKKYNLINAKIILCGGNASYVEKTLQSFNLTNFEYRPKLVLEGLERIYTNGGKNEIKKD